MAEASKSEERKCLFVVFIVMIVPVSPLLVDGEYQTLPTTDTITKSTTTTY